MLGMYFETGCTLTCSDAVSVFFTMPFVRLCEYLFSVFKKVKSVPPGLLAVSSSRLIL